MKLYGEIKSPNSLSIDTEHELLMLLDQSFENVKPEIFKRDLEEKDEVFLLRDAVGKVCGFSTAQFFEHQCDNQQYRVVFSGDTIISREFWGSLELPILWGMRMYREWLKAPQSPLIWMLISKGIRTYKFLPVFF